MNYENAITNDPRLAEAKAALDAARKREKEVQDTYLKIYEAIEAEYAAAIATTMAEALTTHRDAYRAYITAQKAFHLASDELRHVWLRDHTGKGVLDWYEFIDPIEEEIHKEIYGDQHSPDE